MTPLWCLSEKHHVGSNKKNDSRCKLIFKFPESCKKAFEVLNLKDLKVFHTFTDNNNNHDWIDSMIN